MIRCVRLWTGEDQNSHAEEGIIDLAPGACRRFPHRQARRPRTASSVKPGQAQHLQWRTAPVRQLVIQRRGGKLSTSRRAAASISSWSRARILLAEDTTGGGHSWKLVIGRRAGRRLYVVLDPAAVPTSAQPFFEEERWPSSAGRQRRRRCPWLAPASSEHDAGHVPEGAAAPSQDRDHRAHCRASPGEFGPWNNAGTGHAANCELNYTPQRADGSVDISKALEVNVEFDMSRQFWSYLIKKGAIASPSPSSIPCRT